MSFELYDRSYDLIAHRRAQVSIRKGGDIGINQPAYKAVREPEAVLLQFDRLGKRVAIKPCKPDDPNAFPVVAPWKRGKKDRTARVTCKGFLNYFKIAHERGRRYDARYEDGMLIISLNGKP